MTTATTIVICIEMRVSADAELASGAVAERSEGGKDSGIGTLQKAHDTSAAPLRTDFNWRSSPKPLFETGIPIAGGSSRSAPPADRQPSYPSEFRQWRANGFTAAAL